MNILRLGLAVLLFAGNSWAQERPLLGPVRVGILIGTNINNGPLVLSLTGLSGPSERRAMIGPSVEFSLPHRWSAEANALYRPLLMRYASSPSGGAGTSSTNATGGGPIPVGTPTLPDVTLNGANIINQILTTPRTLPQSSMWEVPVLLKQHFAWRRLRPFAGAGPTFRKTNLAGPVSPYGVVAGAGIDIPWWRVRISPTVRYTHWASRYSYDKVFQNQFEILVGASF